LSCTRKLSVQPCELGKSLKRFAGDSRCETSSSKAHTGLSKLPFCKVKVKHFSERVTDHLTLCLYHFAHFLVTIVKSLTTIALVWYRAGHAQLLVPVLNVPELVAVVVGRERCPQMAISVILLHCEIDGRTNAVEMAQESFHSSLLHHTECGIYADFQTDGRCCHWYSKLQGASTFFSSLVEVQHSR